jgi:D-glycero-D-manno-heptose 1,7-bisphosphate phosphatase
VTGGRAVFLDRDGTIVEDQSFLKDPNQVRLLPGAAEAIRRLQGAGWRVVVVTNQSGIARGLVTETEYQAVDRRMRGLLEMEGAKIDASYYCPHFPEITGPCECRKPGIGHYLSAAARFGIEFRNSVWMGDRITDLLPGTALGGRAILVLTGEGAHHAEEAGDGGFPVVEDLSAAADLILS